jgi:hypothetical protein
MTRSIVTGALALLAALVAVTMMLGTSGRHVLSDPEDLRAFYCAGEAVAQGRDPYLAEPLRSCEVREARAAGLVPYARLARPAPLPGYDFAPLAALARLSFATVTQVYALCAILALSGIALLLRRLSDVPLVAIFAALVLSLGWISIANGQIVPFALLALCACAYELWCERPVRASACAVIVAIEPHIALPVWIALAYAEPKTRIPLAIGAVIFATTSLALIGPHATFEYLSAVLPAHARSELGSTGQFSLTSLLYRGGLSADIAMRFGNVSYLFGCVLGIFVARRLSRLFGAPELLALVPAAFAVFGGPFVHLTQLAVAIPAIVVLCYRLPERRSALGAALLLLAIPWEDLVQNPMPLALLLAAVVAVPIAASFWRDNLPFTALAVVGTLALVAIDRAIETTFAPPPLTADAALAAVDTGGTQLAETTWRAFVAATQSGDSRPYLATHLPTWAGLALALTIATVAAYRTTLRDRLRIRESYIA